MTEQTFTPDFVGYWRNIDRGGLPMESGVFCVYECYYDSYKKKVYLNELIYIGESNNVNRAVFNHDKLTEWTKFVRPGHELCYSFCALERENRKRVAAALIYLHKPPANEEYRNNFPFPKTTIRIKGQTTMLRESFVANRRT